MASENDYCSTCKETETLVINRAKTKLNYKHLPSRTQMRKGERGWGGDQTEEDLRAQHTQSEAEQLNCSHVVVVH